MFDLSSCLNLPLLGGAVLAISIFLYVLLDGFDLGIGILFPFAPSDDCRSKLMSSIAPFWDGNETWLVLGGGGLFALFPVAYSILLPAFYIPLILMLLGLVFRGIAFEFRFKAKGYVRLFWEYAFHYGSLCAAFFQGVILGAFVQGVKTDGFRFTGHSFDWLSGFSLMTGVALVFGYALLGATWTIMKTEGKTQAWARICACYTLPYVVFFMGIVSLWVPFLSPHIFVRWFRWPNLVYLSPIPLVTFLVSLFLFLALLKKREVAPFLLTFLLFSLGYFGLAVSLWPWIVPYHIPVWTAAAASSSLSLILVGVGALLPFTLGYTAYAYYVFRGKTKAISYD